MFRVNLLYLKVSILSVLILTTASVFGQKERKYIREGNDVYKLAIGDTGQVDTSTMRQAAELYRKAIEKSPTSYEAKYNLANATFKLGDYEAAEREYKAIRNITNTDTAQAKTLHNLGNSLLMQGKLQESIDAYKGALRLNPSDYETKYNLAFAQNKLNQQQQQQQEQQSENQEQQQQDQNQQQQNQQQQEQQAQKQQAQEKEMQEAQKKEGEEKDEKQYSKEDAARMLEAIQNEEQQLQDKLNKQKSRNKTKLSRDW